MEEKIKVSELIEVLKVPTFSKREYHMQNYIKKQLKKLEIPFEEDDSGNIFRFIENTPLLSAHMDTVGGADDIAVLNLMYYSNGIIQGLGNIGADDKVGIFIILKLLEEYDNLSFAFTVEEETGSVGANSLSNVYGDEISKCLYGIIIDRRGDSDIIGSKNDYCVREFEEDILSIVSGYKVTMGSISDADVYNEYISCINISCGYYKPHTADEYVIWRDVLKTYHAVKTIITRINKKYAVPVKTPIVKYMSKKEYSGSEYGYYDSYYSKRDVPNRKESVEYFFKDDDDIMEDVIDEIKDSIEIVAEELKVEIVSIAVDIDNYALIVKTKKNSDVFGAALYRLSNEYGVTIEYDN